MTEPIIKKRVDESWKEQAEKEKQSAPQQAAQASQPKDESAASGQPGKPDIQYEEEGMPQAKFDIFISGLAMEALIALGDMAHPATRRQSTNLAQAKYLIDVMGIIEEKTRGNLSVDENKLLQDALYQLRMRYMSRSSGVATP